MSTKFFLILQVCSFLTGECKPAVQIPQLFNTWEECATHAPVEGLKLLKQEGSANINSYKLAVKYGCYETQSL